MTAPLLQVRDVSVQFGAFRALSNVTFDVAPGELVALIGPNGAGKTTVLNVLAGDLKPRTGDVTFKGKSLSGLRVKDIVARGLARTFQAAEPFESLTVRENVMVGGAWQRKVPLVSALTGLGRARDVQAELGHMADAHLATVGLTGVAGKAASSLSAGQRRLLSIARVLASDADLLVLDEPGAGLNDGEKQALGDVLMALVGMGKTVLFIDHDMPLVSRVASRIMVLDRGHLIANGAPGAVRSDPRVLDAYLGRRKPEPSTAAPRSVARGEPVLRVNSMALRYGGLRALDDISLDVTEGEIVAVIGANGAGKSSLLHGITRMELATAARLELFGKDLRRVSADKVAAHGMSLVPERNAMFTSLTVLENLAVGRYARRRAEGFHRVLWQSATERAKFQERVDFVYALFPVLAEKASVLAGNLSGGQRQMVAISRALMGEPRLLLLDEPSLGLAPQVVDEIMACIVGLRRQGLTVLLVEQNVSAALEIADRGIVIANGRVVMEGPADQLRRSGRLDAAYLGGEASGKPNRSAVLQASGA